MSRADDPRVSTVKGAQPSVAEGPTPTEETLPDGQKADHWVLSAEERAKGQVRPVRLQYRHVGIQGPKRPLVDLTDEQKTHYGDCGYIKYEKYDPPKGSALGRFWTQVQLDKIGKGCGTVTRMPQACAETYAVKPGFYGSTWCCGCRQYLPVGEDGEFVWLDDGTRVGT